MNLDVQSAIPHPFTKRERLYLPSCDGSQIIARSKKVFAGDIAFYTRGGLQGDLHVDLDVPSIATPRTQINVFERDTSREFYKVTYREAFAPLGHKIQSLALTQAQVVTFASLYRSSFEQGTPSSESHVLFKVKQPLLGDNRQGRWKG